MKEFEKQCFEHMQQGGITGEKALKERIRAIFATYTKLSVPLRFENAGGLTQA